MNFDPNNKADIALRELIKQSGRDPDTVLSDADYQNFRHSPLGMSLLNEGQTRVNDHSVNDANDHAMAYHAHEEVKNFHLKAIGPLLLGLAMGWWLGYWPLIVFGLFVLLSVYEVAIAVGHQSTMRKTTGVVIWIIACVGCLIGGLIR